MTDTYEIFGKTVALDPETGLPLLPDGMFWRVKRGRVTRSPLRVEIRRKAWIGSKEVDHTWADTISKESVLSAAAFAYTQWVKEAEKKRANAQRQRALGSLIGDYPPKKLEIK